MLSRSLPRFERRDSPDMLFDKLNDLAEGLELQSGLGVAAPLEVDGFGQLGVNDTAWRRIPARLLSTTAVSGQNRYAFQEQDYDATTGVYTDKSDGMQGDGTTIYATELNNAALTTFTSTSPYVWLRYKGVVNDQPVYEFNAAGGGGVSPPGTAGFAAYYLPGSIQAPNTTSVLADNSVGNVWADQMNVISWLRIHPAPTVLPGCTLTTGSTAIAGSGFTNGMTGALIMGNGIAPGTTFTYVSPTAGTLSSPATQTTPPGTPYFGVQSVALYASAASGTGTVQLVVNAATATQWGVMTFTEQTYDGPKHFLKAMSIGTNWGTPSTAFALYIGDNTVSGSAAVYAPTGISFSHAGGSYFGYGGWISSIIDTNENMVKLQFSISPADVSGITPMVIVATPTSGAGSNGYIGFGMSYQGGVPKVKVGKSGIGWDNGFTGTGGGGDTFRAGFCIAGGAGGGSSITVGTTPIAGGTSGNILYNNGGTVGEIAGVSGTF